MNQIIDDTAFAYLVFTIGIIAIGNKIIDDYGYDTLISQLTVILIVITCLSFLIFVGYFLIKKRIDYINRKREDKLYQERLILEKKEEEQKKLDEIERQKELIKWHRECVRNNQNVKKKKEEDDIPDINIDLDVDEGLFFDSKLSPEEKEFLKGNGYESGYFVPIGKPRQELCWVKKNNVESLEHTFLVQNIILELRKYTKEYVKNIVQDADIVFKNKKGISVAIEVETGTNYKKNFKGLKEKVVQLLEKYKANHIVVLTNKKYLTQYRNLNPKLKVILRKDIPAYFHTRFNMHV